MPGPTPDLNKICGDPKAPDERITSLSANNWNVSFLLLIHSTPFAELSFIRILLTFVSVNTVRFSLSRAGTK